MTRFRPALGAIALVWLSCQVGLFAAAPIVLWAGIADELLECTCTHGDHAMCPMHHRPAPGSKICLMRSANSNGSAVLASIFAFVGVVPSPAQAIIPVSGQSVVNTVTTTASRRPTPPDPPPPRA
jgi:hypothetical protein